MKRQVFFDPQTHLIVKEAATVGGVEEEICTTTTVRSTCEAP